MNAELMPLMIVNGFTLVGLIFIIVALFNMNKTNSNLENFLNVLVEILKSHAGQQEEQTIRTIETLDKIREIKKDISLVLEKNQRTAIREKKDKTNGLSEQWSESSKALQA